MTMAVAKVTFHDGSQAVPLLQVASGGSASNGGTSDDQPQPMLDQFDESREKMKAIIHNQASRVNKIIVIMVVVSMVSIFTAAALLGLFIGTSIFVGLFQIFLLIMMKPPTMLIPLLVSTAYVVLTLVVYSKVGEEMLLVLSAPWLLVVYIFFLKSSHVIRSQQAVREIKHHATFLQNIETVSARTRKLWVDDEDRNNIDGGDETGVELKNIFFQIPPVDGIYLNAQNSDSGDSSSNKTLNSDNAVLIQFSHREECGWRIRGVWGGSFEGDDMAKVFRITEGFVSQSNRAYWVEENATEAIIVEGRFHPRTGFVGEAVSSSGPRSVRTLIPISSMEANDVHYFVRCDRCKATPRGVRYTVKSDGYDLCESCMECYNKDGDEGEKPTPKISDFVEIPVPERMPYKVNFFNPEPNPTEEN